MNLHLASMLLLNLILNVQYILAESDTLLNPTGKYTPLQQKALEKLRNVMGSELYKDYMKTDYYLHRWLQTNDFDVGRAKAQIEKTLTWRRENGIDGILEEDFSRALEICHLDMSSTDRWGRPVLISSMASCNLRRLFLTGEFNKVKRFIYYILEMAVGRIHESQLKGRNVSDFIAITNSLNFSPREHACLICLSGFRELLTIYEAYYPLYYYKIIVINMPRAANVILTVIQPLMSERTRSIFSAYGLDKKEWQLELLKLISPDQLDVTLGGVKQTSKYL